MARNAYFDVIGDLVDGKDVLDVGSINHAFDRRANSKDWVFDLLRRRARSVVGIDIARREVAKARAAGYDIREADAETFVSTDRTFDVVFAGDLIEHLSNPGAFLACAHRNLRPDGRLLLVTPNTYGLRELFLAVAGLTNDPPVHAQHTAYFTPTTLRELARRHGFALTRVRYVNIRYRARPPVQLALLAVNRILTAPFPRARQTMILEFERLPGPVSRKALAGRGVAVP
jgi:SAM-dependent methyltransferase